MGNHSANASEPPPAAATRFKQPEWIIAEVYNIFALITVTWVSVGLVVNGRRTGKWRKENMSNVSQVNAGAVYTAAVASFFLSYIRLIPGQATFNIGYNDDTSLPCEVSMDVSIIGYTLTLTCVYVFLWYRQRSLYQHPAMNFANKPWLRYVNWGTLFVMVGSCLFSGVAFAYPENYTYSPRGCVSRPKDKFTVWPIYLSNVIIILGQAMMLFLFLYPLRSQTHGSNAHRIMRILKRSASFAGICVVSDLLAMVLLAVVVPENTTRHVTVTVYDVNMGVNLMSVLLSFESWPEILTSCWKKKAKKRRDALSSTGSAVTADTRT